MKNGDVMVDLRGGMSVEMVQKQNNFISSWAIPLPRKDVRKEQFVYMWICYVCYVCVHVRTSYSTTGEGFINCNGT